MSASAVPPPVYPILVIGQPDGSTAALLAKIRAANVPINIKLYEELPADRVEFKSVWVVGDGRRSEGLFAHLRSVKRTWESEQVRMENGITEKTRWMFVTLYEPNDALFGDEQNRSFRNKLARLSSWLPEKYRLSGTIRDDFMIGKLINMSLVDPHIHLSAAFKGCKSISDAKQKCRELLAKLDELSEARFELNYHKGVPATLYFRRKEIMHVALG